MTTHPIRVGIQIMQQHATYAQIREAWKAVDASGADTLFNWDHFFPLSGDPDGAHLDNWTALGAMAEVTERVQIGCLVSAIGYRNPNLLADMARTLDHLSDGRAILGVGSGWNQRDYEEYGYEFGTAASRLHDLDVAMPVIMDRLARLNPPPIQSPFPILIGGGGEKVTLRIVAQYATIWNGQAEPEVLAHKNRVLDEWCARVGRDPGEIERSAQIFGPQLDRLDDYLEAGITHFILDAKGPDYDLAPLERVLAWRDRQGG
ncbi:MAG TPA: LLM class F420-dependent oxidoreductase [Thermomicrobiales bacterium]|nr:LLM class F420-dependent oxidoreductase [Thermomicrobiales bacterium]